MTSLERYLPPEAVAGFFRGLKLGLLTFVAAFGPAVAASASDSLITPLEWTLATLGALGAAAVVLGGRTAEGYGDAKRHQADAFTAEELELIRKVRSGEITYIP